MISRSGIARYGAGGSLTARSVAVLLLALAAAMSVAQAQPAKWPEKPVRIIVAVAPGGSVDAVARMVAGKLAETYGQQFVVDNRAGAGGTIGAAIAARANPDGYTLLMMSPGYSGAAALYPRLPYDPIKDIVAVGMVAAGPMFLAAHPSVKATNIKDFVELLRASPGTLKYGSGGVGSSTHLAVELLRQMTKTDVVHVPYKGIGPAISDLLGGQIQFYVAPGVALLPHAGTGRLRLLAVTGEQRSPDFPDTPAVSEVVPGYAATFWYGLGAPAGTPRHVISQLNQELARVVNLPDLVKRLRADNLKPTPATPAGFARVITQEIATWSRVVKAGNIKVE